MRFSERVRHLASERNLSQADIARLTGMYTSQVTHLFNGRANAPRVDTVCALANAFGVSMGELCDGLEFERNDGSVYVYTENKRNLDE